MTTPMHPSDEQEVCEAVAEAVTLRSPLEIVGGGSKQAMGYPHRETTPLSIGRLDRIVDYDPAELVLTVQAGVRLTQLAALLDGHNQMLAFEPYDFADVAGGVAQRSTIGGVVGAGLAGSRRLSAGSVRDHCLGFTAVNGLGHRVRAGGKVVKNVTGYDLPKLMAGSWGQLAVITELTLKVLPKPSTVRTLAMRRLSDERATAAMTRAVCSQAAVAAASHVPQIEAEAAVTAIRIEGFGPSVDAREQMLRSALAEFGAVETLEEQEAVSHWRKVQTGGHLPVHDRPNLWRISIQPARGARLMTAIANMGGIALLDWAGGLAWARTKASTSADTMRGLAEHEGGHAILVDAPADVRAVVPALHPEPPALAALSARVREAFDPYGLFDPLRFAAR